MLGLDPEKMDNTIGIVVNLLPSSMGLANEEGESIKWLIGGQACATGVVAAEMAARGVKGMRDVIKGWLPVIAEPSASRAPDRGRAGGRGRLRPVGATSGIVTKHYATVGPLTASLDATFDLINKHGISAEDISEIHVDAMKRTAVFNTRHPKNEIAARASLPYMPRRCRMQERSHLAARSGVPQGDTDGQGVMDAAVKTGARIHRKRGLRTPFSVRHSS